MEEDESAEYGIKMPEWRWSHVPSGLLVDRASGAITDGEVVTYCFLQSIVGRGMKRRDLADHRGITKRTLQRHISNLDEAGWLDREKSETGEGQEVHTVTIRHTRRNGVRP